MQPLPLHRDILIVGAGPVGMSLALALRNLGADPLLIERRSDIPNTSRAAVIHAKTLEMLEDLGATAPLLAAGVKVPVFRVRDRGQVLVTVDFSSLETPYPFTLMCPQNRTEEILAACLDAAGGTIARGVELLNLTSADDRVVARVKTAEGPAQISAKWVVGCDGAHSPVRDTVGIPFVGAPYQQDFVLADVEMEWPLSRDEVSLFFSPQGLVVVAPLPDERYRIVATLDHAPEAPGSDLFTALLAERGPPSGNVTIKKLLWASRFRLAHRIAKQFVAGRVVLCGDAAHVHSPAGGQGMNTGIQDAVSLAPALVEAVNGADDERLAKWQKDRLAIAHDLIATTDRLTKAATMHSPIGRTVRNSAISIASHWPGLTDRMARKLSELDRVG